MYIILVNTRVHNFSSPSDCDLCSLFGKALDFNFLIWICYELQVENPMFYRCAHGHSWEIPMFVRLLNRIPVFWCQLLNSVLFESANDYTIRQFHEKRGFNRWASSKTFTNHSDKKALLSFHGTQIHDRMSVIPFHFPIPVGASVQIYIHNN